MPCDSIQTTRVQFNLEHTDTKLLKAALESLGYLVTEAGKTLTFNNREYTESGQFIDGKLTVTQRSSIYSRTKEFDVAAVKKAYSHQVVQLAARKFGWNLKRKSNNQDVYEVQKKGGF